MFSFKLIEKIEKKEFLIIVRCLAYYNETKIGVLTYSIIRKDRIKMPYQWFLKDEQETVDMLRSCEYIEKKLALVKKHNTIIVFKSLSFTPLFDTLSLGVQAIISSLEYLSKKGDFVVANEAKEKICFIRNYPNNKNINDIVPTLAEINNIVFPTYFLKEKKENK